MAKHLAMLPLQTCLRYEGEWAAATYEGTGSETFAKGSTYRGQYTGGLRSGWGVCRWVVVGCKGGSRLDAAARVMLCTRFRARVCCPCCWSFMPWSSCHETSTSTLSFEGRSASCTLSQPATQHVLCTGRVQPCTI